jgi:glycosyltransferase involved in cell wall biosynthesis
MIGASVFVPTAYGKIMNYVSQGLAKEHEVYIYGQGYQGTEQKYGNATLIPTVEAGIEMYSRDPVVKIFSAIDKYKPDLVLAVGDLLFYEYLIEGKKDYKYKLAVYFPVDSSPPRYRELLMCKDLDYAIVPSKFGKETLEKYGVKNIHFIPHGYNPDIFKPRDKKEARKVYGVSEDLFLFGYFGTNCWRKNLTGLLQSFKLAFKNEPKTKLALITPSFARTGSDLIKVGKYMGIQRQLLFIAHTEELALTEPEIAVAYDCMDAYVSASTGEGASITLYEALASGLPSIAPNYSAMTELLDGCGILTKIKGGWFDVFASWRCIADEADLARAMRRLYQDQSLREELSKKAIEKAKTLTWAHSNAQWLDLLNTRRDIRTDKQGLEHGN